MVVDAQMQRSDSLSVSVLGGRDQERVLKYTVTIGTFCCAKDCVRPFAVGEALEQQRQVGHLFLLVAGSRVH